MANVDFDRSLASPAKEISLLPLSHGLPERWQRPYLFEAHRQGIQDELFFPALHGLTHFCAPALARALAAGGERSQLVHDLWRAQTPYIYARMPWIGYEYWDPELDPKHRFLSLDDQRSAIHRALQIFQELFAAPPLSACAPGYRANDDTHRAWFEAGVRVAQNGPADCKPPFLDARGMLHTFRALEMEPAIVACDVNKLVQQAERCFQRGVPAIVSIHAINFHSTIRDFRTPTLAMLDEFLTIIEKKWPNLCYVNDADLFHIATEGSYIFQGDRIRVGVTKGEGEA